MTLHDLTAADAAEYHAFFSEGLRRHPECFGITPADEAREAFPTTASPDSFTLALRTGAGTLAGIVSCQREGANRERHRHRATLFRMYVAREHAGLGLGKRLITEVLRRVVALGDVEDLGLVVVATNTRARRLYESFGFVAWGTQPRAFKHADGRYFDKTEMNCAV